MSSVSGGSLGDRERDAVAFARAELGGGVRLGVRPAVLVVDFSTGFTDERCRLGARLDAEVEATKGLLDVAREVGVFVVFTTASFDASGNDAGIWAQKIPSLVELTVESGWAEIDPRLERRPEEPIVTKKGASAFFATNVGAILTANRVDSVVLCGASTSGCIRATAVDLLQHGYPSIVPRECVGDRTKIPHETNLVDIAAKYADVVSVEDACRYLRSVPSQA